MATLRQESSFGPGVYRGHKFDRQRLQEYVDGTNKAIASGIPIPLLKKHAKLNADDEETSQFADEEGVGWVTRVGLNKNGEIWWEAENVPADVAEKVESKTVRFTSPEFRPYYESEKAGVYSGPVIRHFAFVPKPGNPHQGPIQSLALSELAFQFSEDDRMPLETEQFAESSQQKKLLSKHGYSKSGRAVYKKDEHEMHHDGQGMFWTHYKNQQPVRSGIKIHELEPYLAKVHGSQHAEYPAHSDDAEDDKDHALNKELGKGSEGNSVDDEELTDAEDHTSEDGAGDLKKKKDKKEKESEEPVPEEGVGMAPKDEQFSEGPNMSTIGTLRSFGYKPHPTNQKLFKHKDGAHSVTAHKDGSWSHEHKPSGGRPKVTSGHGSESLSDHLGSVHYPTDEESQHAEDEYLKDNKDKNDIPEHMDDPAETSPPSMLLPPESPPINPDMPPPPATDLTKLSAVLAGLQRLNIVLPSDFDFVKEGAIDILLAAINSSLKAESEAEAKAAKDEQQDEAVNEMAMPFSEEDLAALPEKARNAILAGQEALARERKAKEEAEAKALAFAEQERRTRNEAAKEKAIASVKNAVLPPALKEKLLKDYEGDDCIQFSEGEEERRYTPSEVALLLAQHLPPSLQFLESDVKDAELDKKTIGSEQFFEHGDISKGHVSDERAREIVAANPVINNPHYGTNRILPNIAAVVAEKNGKHPNNVMRDM